MGDEELHVTVIPKTVGTNEAKTVDHTHCRPYIISPPPTISRALPQLPSASNPLLQASIILVSFPRSYLFAMEAFKTVAGAAMALLVVLAMVFEAQAQCVTTTQLIACQSAVTQVGATPSLQCCQKVQAALAAADGPKCLCDAMTSSTAAAFNVIKSEAIKLPSKCKKLMGLTYAPNYNCAGS